MRVNRLKITQKEIHCGRHIKFVKSASLLALAECSTWELGCQKAQAAREEVLEVCSAQTRAEGRNEEEAVRCIPDFASLPSFLSCGRTVWKQSSQQLLSSTNCLL